MTTKIEAAQRINASLGNDVKAIAERLEGILQKKLKLVGSTSESGTYAGVTPITELRGRILVKLDSAVSYESFTLNVKSHPKFGICFQFIDG